MSHLHGLSWTGSPSPVQVQRSRWLAGDERPVESLLAERPDLAADQSLLLDLIYNEFCIREELGRRPDRNEYVNRFPELRQPLQALFDVHDAADSSRPTASADLHVRAERESPETETGALGKRLKSPDSMRIASSPTTIVF